MMQVHSQGFLFMTSFAMRDVIEYRIKQEDGIKFIKKFDHLDFVAAVEAVAGESGISVVYDQTAKPVDSRFKRFNKLMNELSDFYQSQLKQSATKKKAIDYAKKRGISGSIAKRFELGLSLIHI